MADLDVLRSLGDQLVPPPLESLRATARRRDRRRAAATAGVVAAAVAVIATGVLLLTPDDADRAPRPTESPTRGDATSRPLTYADSGTVFYGGRSVEVDGRVVELDVTDDGVAVRTDDGRIWFTDGSSVDEIGAVGDPGPGYGDEAWPLLSHPGWMLSTNAGSRLVWFEFPAPGEPEVVVYDTASAQEVTRDTVSLGSGPGRHTALPAGISERFVYWYPDPDPNQEVPEAVAQVRYDPETGEQAPVTAQDVLDDLDQDAAVRSVLLKGDGRCDSCPGFHYSDGMNQQMGLDLRVGTAGVDGVAPVGPGDMVAKEVAGDPFSFDRVPDYDDEDDDIAWMVQWLDDETVVIVNPRPRRTDLVECHLDTDACEVAASGPTTIVVPEFGLGVYFG